MWMPSESLVSPEEVLAYREYVDNRLAELEREYPTSDVLDRVDTISDLIDGMWDATETLPTVEQRRRMANYLMVDYLVDQHKHHRDHEYPFHTPGQTARRREREVPGGRMDDPHSQKR